MAEQASDGGAAPRIRAALATWQSGIERIPENYSLMTMEVNALAQYGCELGLAVRDELPPLLERLASLEAERAAMAAVVDAARALVDSCGETSDGVPGSYEMVSCFDYDAREAVYAALDAYERAKGDGRP